MIFKRNNTYWYKFCWTIRGADGVSVSYVVRRSARTSNKRHAQEMQEEHRRALRLGQVHPRDPWPKPAPLEAPTFVDVTKRFLDHAKLHVKAGSLRFYEVKVAQLVAFREFGSALIPNINGELIARYVRHRLAAGASATTVNGELRTLRRILHVAYDWEIIDRIPAVHELPSKAGRDRVISFQEELKYFAVASGTLKRAAILAVDTGLRPNSELFVLEWTAVDLGASTGLTYGAIRVRAGKTSNAVRVIPLTPRAREALLQQRESAPHHRWVFRGAGNSGHLETLQASHRKAIK